MLARLLIVLLASVASAAIIAPAGMFTRATSVVPTVSIPRTSTIILGRGDKRTAKGKRKAKSFGNCRPRNSELRKRAEEKDEE
mmetsp:Transcript_40757/g.86889  ORF Transcript_40757/g.86889 Transcript_40757/m.86889 type:complete len:83 (-) Transcript_40757:544-792(-)